jgi:hypothetical protein
VSSLRTQHADGGEKWRVILEIFIIFRCYNSIHLKEMPHANNSSSVTAFLAGFVVRIMVKERSPHAAQMRAEE